MSRILSLVILSFIILTPSGGFAAYQGPLSAPFEGYGSWGSSSAAPTETFSMTSQGYTNTVSLYFPSGLTEAAPTVFFAPGWDVSCEGYGELLRFLVSKGYAVVCDDYEEDSGAIGGQLFDTFTEAADRYPDKIDTSRFGIAGHSAGAGLLPSLGYRLAVDENWGASGMFLFSSAPWIDFDLTDVMVTNYPEDMKLIIQMYEDDTATDLRTSIDQFECLSRIQDTEKDYIILRPSDVSGYQYTTTHETIGTGGDGYGVWDAMDSWGIFRLVDALADYAFTGSSEAWAVALGDGCEEQIEMEGLRDLISTDDPRPTPGLGCVYPCDISDNPRRSHCADYDSELPGAVLISPAKHLLLFAPSPTFEWEAIPTATGYTLQLRPLLADGEPDWGTSYGESLTADEGGCSNSPCSRTISSSLPQTSYVWWIKGSTATLESVWSRRGYFRNSGDVDGNSLLNGLDMDALLIEIYGGSSSFPDVDGDGLVDIADVVALISLLGN